MLKLLFILPLFASFYCSAQKSLAATDSVLDALQKIPIKYFNQVDNKIDKYSSRITNKTEKSLAKLARWENKIHNLLQKVNPEADQKLFGNNHLTFSSLLEDMKKRKQSLNNYRAQFDTYRDKITTTVGYLNAQKDDLDKKYLKPVANLNKKIQQLNDEAEYTEKVEAFVRERKKLLIAQSMQFISKSKYLKKLDKEAYYYAETMRNYKELFSDTKKAEELALKALNKIPAFQKFTQENSQLASMFGLPGSFDNPRNLAGLQTRTSVQDLVQTRLSAGGPNAREAFSQRMQMAQAEMNEWKDKVIKAGGNSSDAEVPSFKPNTQKSKTFFQRLEYGSNFQFSKANSLLPTAADLGLSVGYKLNDKSIVGVGASYKMGIGSFQHLKISHEGIGVRSFIDWKIKKQFYVTGGFEMNYNSQFKNMTELKSFDDWQQSGLIGLSRKINVNTKWFKGTKLQLLYDMLAYRHVPVSQPFVFRIGYSFKN